MAKTFPAVTVSGILESGKTTFINDSLKNGDFGDLGRVLILATEEGEVEYDPAFLSKYNATFYNFDSPEEFTVEKINELIKSNKPHCLFIEENAMWDWSQIKLPPYIIVEQAFTIIDATTFKVYFNNMRQKFSDMLSKSTIVIMNRAEETSEMAGFKRNLRLMNKDAYIIVNDKNGKQISFAEELPYKISDEMSIKDSDFGIFYIDTFDNRARYDGKTVEFNCMTMTSKQLPDDTFVAGRLAMTCCANDIQLIWHLCSYNKEQSKDVVNKGWAHIKAKVHYLDVGEDEPQLVFELLDIKKIPEIAEPVVSLTQ